MTTLTDIVNRALQVVGTRTTVSDVELATNSTNEAIQANLCLIPIRRQLLRMAPWDCGLKTANLVYITSVPGTPENTSVATNLWTPGQPTPPWAYEYQYPVDCLRACWIIPSQQTGFSGGVPITTAVTGGAPSNWVGPPVKYKVQTDTFIPVTAATVANGGTGYAVGDIITLASGNSSQAPIGAPCQLRVEIIGGGGTITTVSVVSILPGDTAIGGSYFAAQANPVAQGSSTGSGTGATFTLTFGSAAKQRVILTNQEFAILVYVCDIIDPNVLDDLFIEAYVRIVGATIANALSGDKKLIKMAIDEANIAIGQARAADANEGLTINDVTPDWIRIRGVDFGTQYSGPYTGFDWGSMWPNFG
jgi:hypothetical protein